MGCPTRAAFFRVYSHDVLCYHTHRPGHHRQVVMGLGMDSGKWPADWALHAGNNTGLGFDLL